MSSQTYSLHQLGWQPSFAEQLTLDDFEAGYPARVVAIHRNGLAVLSSRGAAVITPPRHLAGTDRRGLAVGDWVLIEQDADRVLRLLERRSLLARMAAGDDGRMQSIAANLDSLFVVTSCNDDFNPSRLERYLALAWEAGVEPVVLLTKADLAADPAPYLDTVHGIAPGMPVLAIDATSSACIALLSPWLDDGQTVAFVGSSGVGKSTLTNTLLGASARLTAGIREDDARGRHTTTARQMFPLPTGAWLIDTPGMRELRIGAAAAGVQATFEDIEALAAACRFRDCGHAHEAGCAVAAAIADGRLDARRLANYRKLQREAEQAARSLREQRERSRQFGAMARSAMRAKRERQGR